MRHLSCMLCLFVMGLFPAMAQNLMVSGTVTTKEDKEPLPGTTVTVKGTNFNTVSGEGGKFTLAINGMTKATLVFSFVGFKVLEVEVEGNTANISAELEESPLSLQEEMVITGFASSVKRQNLANSVASVSAKDLSRVPVQTVDAALSGKFTGVTVRENSGAPGGGIQLKLRGISTVSGSSDPLYVIDGVIASNLAIQSGVDFVTAAAGAGSATPQDNPTNRIADLNPNDIESIEVLKGPSAAAIYGAKASNGVVLITTKRGTSGKTKYNFSYRFGQREIIRKLGQRRYTAETASQVNGAVGQAEFDRVADANGNYELIDWEELMYGNVGDIHEYNFSASGGDEKTSYYVSGNSLEDEGIIERTGYDKMGIRMNLDRQLSDNMRLSLSSNFVKSSSDRGLTNNENSNGVTFGVALVQTPNFWDGRPDENGNYPFNPFAASNPLQTRDFMVNREDVQRTINSVKFDWALMTTANQSLDFNITAGYDFFSQESLGLFPAFLQFEAENPPSGTIIQGETEAANSNLYFNLVHSYISDSGSIFTTSGGIQLEEQDSNRILVVGEGLIPGTSSIDTAASISLTQQNKILQRDRGYFIQEEIQLNEAIMFTAGMRGDSSSANGDAEKFYTYPKTAMSIRLSEYNFWEGLSDVFNEFKFRIAWGRTGNLPQPSYKYNSFNNVIIQDTGGLLVRGIKGNPEIEPEITSELEIGFDGSLFDDRATFEFSYFDKDVDDFIILRELEPSTGFSREPINAGALETEGFEFGLSFQAVKTEKFDWTNRLNFFTFDTTVTELRVPAFDLAGGGFARSLGIFHIEEGESTTQIKGIENGEFVKIGDETPDFQLSWDSVMQYKSWTLSWLLDWKEGGDVLNLTRLLSDLNGTSPDLDTAEGQARAGAAFQTASQLVEDGGYIKLREIRLMYNMSRGTLDRWFNSRVSSLNFSLSGRNIWNDTDYTSYDPEVSNFGSRSIGSIEVTPFPTSKAYYFQITAEM